MTETANYSSSLTWYHGHLIRYVKLQVAHAPGMQGTVFIPPTSKKPLVSDPGMHLGTCVTHVSWCVSGSLTRGGGKNVPGIPGTRTNRNYTYMARGPLTYINPKKTEIGFRSDTKYFSEIVDRKPAQHINEGRRSSITATTIRHLCKRKVDLRGVQSGLLLHHGEY